MKAKYLLGMLLGGAMLTACSEDDLNLGQVAQEENLSAPVFSVYFDDNVDPATRATVLDNWQLSFNGEDDLMSLYHGVIEGTSNADYAQFTGWQNAIYYGTGDGNDGKITFKTQAMVTPGGAIMIYPADTEFDNDINYGTDNLGTNAPVIKIKEEQGEDNVEKTPYMSEILTIDKKGTTGTTASAGYQQPYEIALKRVGSTFIMNMTLQNSPAEAAGVDDIELTSVELKSGPTDAFTTGVSIKSLSTPAVAYSHKNGTNAGNGKYDAWKNQSELDLENITLQSNTLSTKHVDNTKVDEDQAKAFFTLLPSKVTSGSVTAVTGGSAVVNTTYGKVELIDATGDVWQNKDYNASVTGSKPYYTVTEGLNRILTNDVLWAPTGQTTSPFYAKVGSTEYAENAGGYMNRTVKVNLAKLDMHMLHIKNEKQLKNALAVFDVIVKTNAKPVTFVLDGNDDGQFVITEKALWEDVAKRSNQTGNHVSFMPCQDKGEACNAVVLRNDGEVAEVPALKLLPNGSFYADVELDGDWQWTDVTVDPSLTANNGKEKQIGGIQDLIVNENITLKNWIASADIKGKIVNKGTATVSGDVTLQTSMDNFNKILIGTSDRLRAEGAGVVLNNRETQKVETSGEYKNKTTGLTAGAAEIVNENVLGIIGKDAKINNYGIIRQVNSTSYVLITANADATANVASPFANGDATTPNRIGTIILNDPNGADNNTVINEAPNADDAKRGFIKVVVDETNAEKAKFGGIANYVELSDECAGVKFAADYMPNNIKYIEVTSSERVVFDGDFELKGLILHENTSINIPTDNTLDLDGGTMYLKGDIYNGGTLKYKGTTGNKGAAEFVGYFGGNDTSDPKNITSYGVEK